jgi:hypothetical protein
VGQDSGRGNGRSTPQRDARDRPRRPLEDTPSTSGGSPLPRRSAQRHIEPRLRSPENADMGTPFTAFTPVGSDGAAAGSAVPGASAEEAQAATDAAGARARPTPGGEAAGIAADGAAPDADGDAGDDQAPPPDRNVDGSRAADFHEGAARGRRRGRTVPPAPST